MSAFPLRMVFMTEKRNGDCREPLAQMMVSVPKRCFKRAVKRNRVKRQVREAYRCNKQPLVDLLKANGDKTVSVCFIWTADSLYGSAEIEARVKGLIARLCEKLQA